MKKFLIILGILIVAITVISCSGKDEKEVDKIPPYPPTMIPYLGAMGDPPTNYYGQPTPITDENSGIDTVAEGDWIRIAWKPLIDEDVAMLRIFRFNELDTEPVQIDSIAPPRQTTSYVDKDNDLLERVWYSYFIEAIDFAGNTSVSDTVSFGLLNKPTLTYPPNGAPFDATRDSLKWEFAGFASRYRVYVMDPEHKLIWKPIEDLHTALENDLYVRVPVNALTPYRGQYLYWRVDAYDWDEGQQQDFKSKSMERVFYVP
ncbi:MAG TPA: hypothetical protein GX398_02890 [Candidatus Cloacimonetes bacterium]|jgi:hypothetical protein|nr:hypothetical protein [Candidatus Cloacimonas sp.]HHZ15042.1 hypothetical protein [Candidatus Cloacimonadota bacterium]